MEKGLSSIRSDNIQLESQTTVTRTTQKISVYSEEEIYKLEQDLSSLEHKNRRLREILS